MQDRLPERPPPGAEPIPICVACLGERTDPATGDLCQRCRGRGIDPDPLAPTGIPVAS